MNKLDSKITELFTVVAYQKKWENAETFQNYVTLRNMVDRGIYSRSLAIWLLKESIHQNKKVVA
jgi:hypothetical protein